MIVYTTVFGETDKLQEPQVDSKARFVCFTDQPISSDRWEIIRKPKSFTPKRLCREMKLQPHVVFPDADKTLWIDANCRLTMAPEEIFERHPEGVTALVHHKRQRIRQEVEAILRWGKAKEDILRAQLSHYQLNGWDTITNPQRAIHNGCFLVRHHTPEVMRFCDFWAAEVARWTLRDQMSIDYSAWRTGLAINNAEGTVPRNPYFTHVPYRGVKPTNDF